jgi:ribonuclease D
VIAWDIETTGLDWKNDTIELCNLYVPGDEKIYLVKPGQGRDNMLSLLKSSDILKIFHHAMFDLRFMHHHWGAEMSDIACTKISSKILNPGREKHSLRLLLKEHFDVELDKTLSTSDWTGEITDEQANYAAGDVFYLNPLLSKLLKSIRNKGNRELILKAFKHIPTRVMLEVQGYNDIYTY